MVLVGLDELNSASHSLVSGSYQRTYLGQALDSLTGNEYVSDALMMAGPLAVAKWNQAGARRFARSGTGTRIRSKNTVHRCSSRTQGGGGFECFIAGTPVVIAVPRKFLDVGTSGPVSDTAIVEVDVSDLMVTGLAFGVGLAGYRRFRRRNSAAGLPLIVADRKDTFTGPLAAGPAIPGTGWLIGTIIDPADPLQKHP
jgi:hypothetical protein